MCGSSIEKQVHTMPFIIKFKKGYAKGNFEPMLGWNKLNKRIRYDL